jgi:hypothetical protein
MIFLDRRAFMNLNLEEQTLVATFRGLDADGASLENLSFLTGQCRLEKGEERPECVAEPIFTE